MKHRILHSLNLRKHLADYAPKLGVDLPTLTQAYDWMCLNDVAFEEPRRDGEINSYISYLDVEKRIKQPVAKRFFALLRDELDTGFVPLYGINWPTFVDRWRRGWEQAYNILINKIPSHTVRLAWLRLGGAKIGKGSTIWRNTEVLGVAGLRIGNHVTIASHTIMIAGGHDLKAPEFWAFGAPIVIDDYAWITTRVILLAGAHIGEGAVVAANTVVAKPIEPYNIVGGEGPKVLGQRVRGLNYKVGGKGLFTLFH